MFLQRQKQYKSFTNRRLYHKMLKQKATFLSLCIFDISKHLVQQWLNAVNDKLLEQPLTNHSCRSVRAGSALTVILKTLLEIIRK